MMRWTASGGGNLVAGNVLAMIGADETTHRARQAEAEHCLSVLGAQRRALQP